jgi:hypothetical protein
LHIIILDKKFNKEILQNFFKKKSNFKIITNNQIISNSLKDFDIESTPIDKIFPNDQSEAYKIHEDAIIKLEKYSKEFESIRYEDISIFSILEQGILQEIEIFLKLDNIFRKNPNTIYVSDKFSFSYYSLKKFFDNSHQNSNIKLFFINSDKIEAMKYENLAKYLKINKKFFVMEKLNFFFNLVKKQILKIIFNHIKSKINKNSKIDVLFFIAPSSKYVLEPIVNVIKTIHENNNNAYIFSFDSTTTEFFQSHNLETINLQKEVSILSRFIRNTAESKIILQSIKKINAEIDILSLNKDFHPINNSIFNGLAIFSICKFLINNYHPKSIVAVNDGNKIGNTVILASKKFGINNFSIRTLGLVHNPLLKCAFKADKICIYGQDGFEKLIKLGYDSSRIIITGNPKYDHLHYINFLDEKQKLNEIFELNGSKLIVIGNGRWHDSDEQWMPDFIHFCKKNDFNIIIKAHPIYNTTLKEIHKQKINFFKKKCPDMKYMITTDLSTKMLISAADLIITDHSNFGIEAILMNKPIISTNLEHENLENLKETYDYDVGYFTEDYKELEKYVLEIFDNKNHLEKFALKRKNFNTNWNFKNDGKASERISKLLLSDKKL